MARLQLISNLFVLIWWLYAIASGCYLSRLFEVMVGGASSLVLVIVGLLYVLLGFSVAMLIGNPKERQRQLVCRGNTFFGALSSPLGIYVISSVSLLLIELLLFVLISVFPGGEKYSLDNRFSSAALMSPLFPGFLLLAAWGVSPCGGKWNLALFKDITGKLSR